MSKSSKNKIALFLACASILGGKTSAMNKSQSSQSLAAVGGATFNNNFESVNPRIFKKSKSMSHLIRGLIVGGSVLGAGLLGYEILGDTVFKKSPTLLKLIKGKKSDEKTFAQKNMQIINGEINKSESKDEIRKEFEFIKNQILNYESGDFWKKIILVCDNGNEYVVHEKEVPESLSNKKLFKNNNQKKSYNSRLKDIADIFNGEKEIKSFNINKSKEGIEFSFDKYNIRKVVYKEKDVLIISTEKLEIYYVLK